MRSVMVLRHAEAMDVIAAADDAVAVRLSWEDAMQSDTRGNKRNMNSTLNEDKKKMTIVLEWIWLSFSVEWEDKWHLNGRLAGN